MKNIKWYLVVAIVLIIGTFVVLRFITPEDTWICQNGNWVKHGNPKMDKPTTGCSNEISKNINEPNNKFVNDDFEIIVPDKWVKSESQIPGVTLMVVNVGENNNDENIKKINFKSYYAITYITTKKSLNDYLPEYESEIKSAVSNVIIGNISDGLVNNYPAKFLELNINQQNIDFKTFVALIKGEGNDVWILSFNTTAKQWSNYETLIPEILNSFKTKN